MSVDSLPDVLLYLSTGAFAGLLAGALGVGGGILVVPALLLIFRHHNLVSDTIGMHMAAGTSLAVMMFTALASVRAHRKLGDVLWDVYHRLLYGLIAGTFTGTLLANRVPSDTLQLVFGLFLLLIAVWSLYGTRIEVNRVSPARQLHRLMSFLIGLASGVLGIGGGLLMIPYLTYCGVDIRKITAVSALCTMTVALTGTLSQIIIGWHAPDLPPYATGYVYWPAVLWVGIPSTLFAPLGARFTYILPVYVLRYAFVLLLFATAIGMLI